jgi:hypothetical protein
LLAVFIANITGRKRRAGIIILEIIVFLPSLDGTYTRATNVIL